MIMNKRIFTLHHLSFAFLLSAIILLSSCADDDYLNAIPGESTALVSIDMQKVMNESKANADAGILKSLLHIDDPVRSGIDVSEKIYLFESSDGNLGLCAKVISESDLTEWINKLSEKHICRKITEYKGSKFTVLKDNWIIGYSDEALMIMGPAINSAQAELRQQMAKYLKADEDGGIKGTPMFDKLDSISSPVAIVAQAHALPQKFIAPFILGSPKDADASQILIAAEMRMKDGCLHVEGETFSFNKRIDKALKDAANSYRKISGKYIKSMPADALVGMFINVDGSKFIELLRTNEGLQAMLAGINAAIDIDNIIKSVNGDMAVVMPSLSDDGIKISMSAQLSNKNWLSDVNYWKQSCPKGGKITDWGKDAYYYSDGTMNFYFGVSADNQFYSGSSSEEAKNSIKPAVQPISNNIQRIIKDKKLCMVLNIAAIKDEKVKTVTSLLKPVFGEINAVVYSIK